MRVRVYRNLTASKKAYAPVYSVMYKGRVINHVRAIVLGDVKFIVREAGRQRVIRDKRKNVHAFIEGEWLHGKRAHNLFGTCYSVEVRYNPYERGAFMSTIYPRPVKYADGAFLGSNGAHALFRYRGM